MNDQLDNSIVVIGYGSVLRGDDAVGRLVVEWIEDRRIPDVVTVSVTQLLPELATLIAQARAVIFVDACVDDRIQVIEIHPYLDEAFLPGTSHASAPSELLALVATCYDQTPPAWLVSVPVSDFSLSDEVSFNARESVNSAAHLVEKMILDLHESEVAHA